MHTCRPDLPGGLAAQLDTQRWTRPLQPTDVVVLVKRYICSTELAQKPMLVLPGERISAAEAAPRGFTLVPSARRARNVPKKPRDWQLLARDLRSMYGAKYDAPATYLEDLASGQRGVHVPLLPLPWHSSGQREDHAVIGDYVPHESVLAAIAPSIPLQAVWRRTPNLDPGHR